MSKLTWKGEFPATWDSSDGRFRISEKVVHYNLRRPTTVRGFILWDESTKPWTRHPPAGAYGTFRLLRDAKERAQQVLASEAVGKP